MILANRLLQNKAKLGLINVFHPCWNSKYRHTLFRPHSRRSHGGIPDGWSHESKTFIIRPSFLRSPRMSWQGTSRCTVSEGPTNAKLIYGSKCLHLFSWRRRRRLQPLFRMCGVSRWWLTLVSPSTSAQPCTNLHTCLHDACICVKPYICLLLLIPSSGNVITPLASQTPPESKCVFCAYMYLWIWRGEGNNISPLGGEEMCGFSVCSRVHSDFTHTWATISVLLTQTQAVDTPIMHSALPAGNVAALILEFCSLFIYYFFSQMKY